MKFDRIPTRRTPVRKTLSARLFNKTKTKRQRASAATASPDELEESGINISRSLTIIFAIHIIAIGMIFIHKQYLSDRTPDPVAAPSGTETGSGEGASGIVAKKLSSGDTPYVVGRGDNYPIIAAKHGVDEAELRNMNIGKDIRAGTILSIPKSKRIIAEDPPEVAAIRNQPGFSDSERGLVELLPPVSESPPQVVRPMRHEETEDAPRAQVVGSGRTHILKAGENIWRISNKYKVSQKELMALNNITDPTKLKIGQVIKLP